VWIKELLGKTTGLTPARAETLGSHSLKATCLSWLAKFGVAAAPRRKLGGHVKSKDRSLVEYSRDELSGPLRALDRVIEAVRRGVFDPDSSRSGRFVRDDVEEAGLEAMFPGAETPRVVDVGSETPRPTAETTEDNTTTDNSSSVSSATEAVDTEGFSSNEGEARVAAVSDELVCSPVADALPDFPKDGLVRNLANNVLHGARDGSRLLCGRSFPAKSSRVSDEWPARPYPLCRDCFRPVP
jgi:hypothetical protein